MTESYVIKEGVGGGFAAAHPLLSKNPLKAPSFRSAAAERNLLEVYRTLLIIFCEPCSLNFLKPV
jgi:hypothetical protein